MGRLAFSCLALLLACAPTGSRDANGELIFGRSAPDGGVEPGLFSADPTFQPGFHQALRWSTRVSQVTTFRLRLPLGRGGQRLRVSFRAGDGELHVRRAAIARAGEGGALGSAPVFFTFDGAPAFKAGPRQRVTSDAVSFPVILGDEVMVSFEAVGALAVSAIDAFPGGRVRAGTLADLPGAFGTAWSRAVGVMTIDVEAPPSRAFVALGDSITEGYTDGTQDHRDSWPFLVQQALGLPVANAAVSGQGVNGAMAGLAEEVLPLVGVTDCLVLIGTNDLGGKTADELIERLTDLHARLRPWCRVFAGTLPPKEKSDRVTVEEIRERRRAVNEWLRSGADLQALFAFDDALADSENPDMFAEGMNSDRVHPSVRGHRAMAKEAVRVLSEEGI